MLPDQALHRALEPRTIGGKGRGRRALSDTDDRRAIGRLQVIEECVDGAADAEGAANTDVRLIDDEQHQPATGRILVAGIPGRGRRGGRLFLRFEAGPLGVDDATLRTVHPYGEVTRLQIGHRLPAVIHDGDVDRRQLHRRSKHGLVRLLCARPHGRDQDNRQRAHDPLDDHLTGAAL